jgi:molybdenum cofactor cytidylyltransferase
MSTSVSLKLCAIILAAGESKRFGKDNKLLARIGGVPILERVVKAVSHPSVGKTIVVTGHDHNVVATLLYGYAVELALNKNWKFGMGSSLAWGASCVDDDSFDGVLICLGDLPGLDTSTVTRIIEVFQESGGESIVVPENQGRRGHPVIFPISLLPGLRQLSGDQGAREILGDSKNHLQLVEVESKGIFTDVDSASDILDLT